MPEPALAPDASAELIRALTARGQTLAVAESLTGGQLTAELTRPAGASAVVTGGVVVYATQIKRDVVGVDAQLLERHGPVHPEVARQLAERVRRVLAVDGRPADIGVSTTGVAGPDPQGGQPVGTVYLGISIWDRTESVALQLSGDRSEIRAAAVRHAVSELVSRLAE
ncbi:CinA family protein [Gryllotalpicola ginsengisoli]|uniref:CinA family protein n=1 Tax=Gryllotalpicola ginsengisoli TaxID=444608 RepID=UPI00041BD8E3|nr:nicotinamide-nucleotide amidohydrolase family protein [Gryllotalpicola ginsengisoli]